jgi:5-formyltetrahydrofolate cyclo-ligase
VFICGLAYHGQECDALPAEAHDIPLDWVVTERGSIPIFMMRTFARTSD